MIKRNLLFVACFLMLARCGGNGPSFTPLKKPVGIALSNRIVDFENIPTRLAYVADQFSRSLVVLDTRRETIIDGYSRDDFDYSPIPVGGEPSAVAVDDQGAIDHIFVADRLNKKILAYRLGQRFTRSLDYVPFDSVDLGGATEGRSTRALFRDEGASSTPTLTSLVVHSAKGKNEAWRLTSDGNGTYEVFGSVSGIQANRAVEGKTYESDGGEIKFFISRGGERTTKDDRFFFSTMISNPHTLASSPVDLLIDGRRMYILTQGVPSIVVYDLDLLTEIGMYAIPDVTAVPTHLSLHKNNIFISNAASGNIFSFDTTNQTYATIPTSATASRFVSGNDSNLFIIEEATSQLLITNLVGATVKKLNLSDNGNFFIKADVAGKNLGLIPNISGDVDVMSTASLQRIDANLDEKSSFVNQQFFDVAPASAPQLISVTGKATQVMNETWQMVFEAPVPNTSGLSGALNGDMLSAANATFATSNVRVGDKVLIQGSRKEMTVQSVTDETNLVLTETPATQGNIYFEIRVNDAYLLTGSKSGPQAKRVVSGDAYASDSGSISLRVRSSFNAPETRGDFFSFQTLDPIDPIFVGNQSMAVAGIAFKRISDDRPIAYILQQTNGQISVVSLDDYRLENTF